MNRYVLCLGCAVFALLLSGLIVWQDGASWRVPADRLYPSSDDLRDVESAFCGDTHILDGVELGKKAGQPIITCSHDRGSDESIYVWGDSHARHLLPGLVATFPNQNVHILYFTSCLSQSGIGGFVYEYEGRTALRDACIDRNQRAMRFFLSQAPSPIIIHQYFGYEGQFSEEWYRSTEHIVQRLTAHGSRVSFIGGVPRPDVFLAECIAVPSTIPDWLISKRCKGDRKIQSRVFERNETLEATLSEYFTNPNDVLCINEDACPAVERSQLIYRDKHHLTVFGSRKLIDGVKGEISKSLGINPSP